MGLGRPCIAKAIGVIHLSPLQGLKIVGVHLCGRSLSGVFSLSLELWTPTAKAKAVMGIVMGLRFSHSLALLHGHLTGK
jgi:hypothetical protein